MVAGFIGFLAGQILGVVGDLVGVAVTHYPGGLTALGTASYPPWWSNALGLTGLWIGLAAAIYFASHEGKLRSLPHQWRPRWSDLSFIALGVVCQLVIDLLYAPFHLTSLNKPVHHLFNSAHGPGFVLIAFMTTVLAPFFEEWLFRGVLYRAIAEGATGVARRRAVVWGVLVSAALFGLAHGEPLQFAGLFLFGIVLALLVWRTKRLMPSFLTHVSFNAVALAAVIGQRTGH